MPETIEKTTTSELDAFHELSSRDLPVEERIPLSRREYQILHAIGCGWSTEEISDELGLSAHTTRTHIKNGLRKLGAKTRAHAVALVARGEVMVRISAKSKPFQPQADARPRCPICGDPVSAGEGLIATDGTVLHELCTEESE